MNLRRPLPSNIDAERAVLGAMLIGYQEQNIVGGAIEFLADGKAFYKDLHRRAYLAMVSLFRDSKPIDLVSVVDRMQSEGKLEPSEVAEIDAMQDSCPTSANALYYAELVYQEYKRRLLIHAAFKGYNNALDPGMDVDDALQTAESDILDIRRGQMATGVTTAKDAITDAFKHVKKLYEKEESLIGIPTGFPRLDSLLSGLQASDLIIVAGRPGMGKSALIQNIATHVAIQEQVGVAVFSLESTDRQLALRMLSAEADVPFQHIRTGFLKDVEWPDLVAAASAIAGAPIVIDSTPGISPLTLRAKLNQMRAMGDIGLVMVDYLQLMQSDKKTENRQQEVSAISSALKAVAKDMNVPVIACSQLSRALENRPDKRPRLSDLRESGGIEQDADVVLFLYRDDYYNKDVTDDSAELIIGKQRNGPTGVVNLRFYGQCFKFQDAEH